MTTKGGTMKRTILILLAHLILTACSSPPEPIVEVVYVTATPQPTAYPMVLVCKECPTAINIWRAPDRSTGISGKVVSGTSVSILDKTIYDTVLHYKVQTGGFTGWVSYLFVRRCADCPN
jgi:hypothetical protein